MKFRGVMTAAYGVLLVLSVAGASKADLGKEGTYSGQIGFVTAAEEDAAPRAERGRFMGRRG